MKAWFYSEKYPDEINEFEYSDKLYLKSESGDINYLQHIVTNYNMNTYQEDDFDHWLSVYNPFEDDKLYQHDRELGGPIIISLTSKEHLQGYFDDDKATMIRNLMRKQYNLGGYKQILDLLNEAESCIMKKEYASATRIINDVKRVIRNEKEI